MSKSNGCDSNGQNEMEGTGGQRGRGQARSKADRLKTKQNKTKSSHKWFVGVVLHFEVSCEDVMIGHALIWRYWSNAKVSFQ